MSFPLFLKNVMKKGLKRRDGYGIGADLRIFGAHLIWTGIFYLFIFSKQKKKHFDQNNTGSSTKIQSHTFSITSTPATTQLNPLFSRPTPFRPPLWPPRHQTLFSRVQHWFDLHSGHHAVKPSFLVIPNRTQPSLLSNSSL